MTLRAMLTLARLRSALLPAATWAWTRGVLMLYVYNVIPYISHSDITGDVKFYNRWSTILSQGHFPQHDPTWQYPPGAAIVIELPRIVRSLTGLSYYSAFYAMALASDLIIFLLVVYRCWRTADEAGSERIEYLGAYAYVAAIFMVGPFAFGRYDIVVTMIASLGLVVVLSSATATWRLRGAAIGLGTIVKVWPMALLLGLPRGPQGRRALVWTVIGGAVPTLSLLVMPGALSFLGQQNDRGLEIESVLAAPFLLARHLGYHGVIRNRFGSWEIIGPGTSEIATFCELLTLLGFCWLLWWRRRARLTPERWTEGVYYDASLVAVMISIITSRVLSPQYLVWVCGLLALCLSLAPLKRGGTVLVGPCWLLLATISVTQLEFPTLFAPLVDGSVKAALFVTARNALLVAATIWAAHRLWHRYTVPREREAAMTCADTRIEMRDAKESLDPA
jgi:Glycosyltransferase family 87